MFDTVHLPSWWRLTVAPLLVLIVLLLLFHVLDIDRRVADALYRPGAGFPFQHDAAYEFWLHRLPNRLAVGTFYSLLLLAIVPMKGRSLKKWYVPLWLGMVAMVLSSSMVGTFKRESDMSYCPVELQRFGGHAAVEPGGPWPAIGDGSGKGHCWPAGHATNGLAFLSVYFVLLMMAKPRAAKYMLVAAVLYGNALGAAQVIRGQHFLSHQLWSMAICWFTGLALFWLWHHHLLPRRWRMRSASLTINGNAEATASG